MASSALKFTLKVWATTVLGSPLVYLLELQLAQYEDIGQTVNHAFLPWYIENVVVGFIFSFITWLVFWFVVCIILFYALNLSLQRLLVFLCGVVLTASNVILVTGD